MILVVWLLVRRLIMGPEAEGLFTLFAIAFFLIGVTLMGLGVVGEYVGRIYEQVRQRPRYTVAAVLEDVIAKVTGENGAKADILRGVGVHEVWERWRVF